MAEKTERIVEQKNELKSLTNALKVSQRDHAIVEKREAREQELSVKRQEKMELCESSRRRKRKQGGCKERK